MDMRQLKLENKTRVLEAIKTAAATPFGGMKTQAITQSTKLCLRTVQTHLRALRDEGHVANRRGFWVALGL